MYHLPTLINFLSSNGGISCNISIGLFLIELEDVLIVLQVSSWSPSVFDWWTEVLGDFLTGKSDGMKQIVCGIIWIKLNEATDFKIQH